MRLHPAVLAALAAAFAVAPLAAGAQAPTVPGTPAPGYAPGYFAQVAGSYTFSGCGTGEVAWDPGAGRLVYDTAFCVSGLVTLGTRPMFGDGTGPFLGGFLDYAVTRDARVGGVFAEFGDRQALFGTLTSAACPAGCAQEITFSNASGVPGRQSFSNGLVARMPAAFAPDSILVQLGWGIGPNPFGFRGNGRITLAVTAVPEPSTFALGAAGLVAVGAAARRRRRAA